MYGVIVAGVVMRQRKIVAAFRAANATVRDRATTTAALSIREGLAFRILRSHEILRDAGEQRLYLDEARWEEHRVRRRRVAFTAIAAVLLILAAVLFWALRR